MAISRGDRAIVFLCQGCGLGWSPVGPGTVGSAGAIFLAGLLKTILVAPWAYAVAVAAISAFGIALCGRAVVVLNSKDPQTVVLDEIAAVLLIFVAAPWSWRTALLAFVLFRVLDISKPWPISALESLPGGWGVMADDLMAGVIAALVLYGLTFAGLS
jgi:phosphatidylglycerophosphatase A